MNILVIDDREYDALEVSGKISTLSNNALISICYSQQAALEDIQSQPSGHFEIIFVDQHMPGILGTDLVRKLRDVLKETKTRIIMLTSDGGDETRAHALVSDCDGFLTKPVDLRRLQSILDGSRCHWEASELPTNLNTYWDVRRAQETH